MFIIIVWNKLRVLFQVFFVSELDNADGETVRVGIAGITIGRKRHALEAISVKAKQNFFLERLFIVICGSDSRNVLKIAFKTWFL